MSETILLAHGSGGTLSHRLINEVFREAFANPVLDQLLDAAVVEVAAGKIAITTDSFVVDPIFFPGGDIGKLAVCGTVNDLAVSGAEPKYLSAGFIIEEGFPLADLRRIAASMKAAADKAGVIVVTGDTKVVEKGSADGVFINTTGVGLLPAGRNLSPALLQPGDRVIISGSLGDHGLAILAQREGLSFSTPVESDCAPLNGMLAKALKFGAAIRCMRDPTRGGLATTLNEIARQGNLGITVHEELIPVRPEVAAACGMLGLDPLYMANEGKAIIIAAAEAAADIVAVLRQTGEGREAAIIGEVTAEPPGLVLLETDLGATRVLGMLEGEHLPRIC